MEQDENYYFRDCSLIDGVIFWGGGVVYVYTYICLYLDMCMDMSRQTDR